MSELWLFIVVGLTAGGAYALTSIGVVTVYRGSGVLNFAHGAIGMVGTYVFWEFFEFGAATHNEDPIATWSAGPAMVMGILGGALLGLFVYALVMYPLRNASELARVIATLGVLLALQSGALLLYTEAPQPVPPFLGTGNFDFFGAPMSYTSAIVVVLSIVVSILLYLLFRYTRLGLAATALQVKPVAASTLGISPHPTGIIVWALAGALASGSGILVLPAIGISPTRLTLLINYAFAASLLGRFRSYSIAVAASYAMGIAESVMVKENVASWIRLSVPFVVIVAALVIGGSAVPGRGFAESRLPRLGTGKLKAIPLAVWVGLAVLLTLAATSGWSITVASMAIAALISLSIVIVTGYAGQISLAPFAVMGVAALLAAHTAGTWDLGYEAALLAAIVTGAAVGFVIGLPSVRVRGIDLTVATLGFGIVVSGAVLTYPQFVGGGVGTRGFGGIDLDVPTLFGAKFDPLVQPERFGMLCLILMTLVGIGIANLRRSRAGRRLLGVRANERGAAALGISVGGAKTAAFALGGAVAGVAGWLNIFRTRNATFESGYDVFKSIFALAFTIVGGVGYVLGAIYAGVITTGGPVAYFFTDTLSVSHEFDQWLTVGSGLLVIQIMLQSPDGIIALFAHQGREMKRLTGRMRRRRAADDLVAPAVASARPSTAIEVEPVAERGVVQLRLDGVTVDYGPVRAVDSVSLEVVAGRILGVIGPNGAGKTTLIDGITGFTPLTRGRVLLGDDDVTGWSIRRRARAGLGRTFQNLELFSDLTVRENLLAASDRRDLAGFVTGWVAPGTQQLLGAAAEAAELLELHDILDVTISDLPQGKQRLVAIARAVAARPKVVCLDEPAAGLGEAERDAMSRAIRSLVAQLHLGVLIIEHNIDVVAGLCDHIVVLDFGGVIADGDPVTVLSSDVVRQAYLGTSGGHGLGASPTAEPADNEVPA